MSTASPSDTARTRAPEDTRPWAVGWGLAVVVYTVVFSLASPDMAWRVLFWTGALPALFVLYLRRRVRDAPRVAERTRRDRRPGSFGAIFGRAVGAFFPTVVGFLASGWGVGGAMAFGALGYGIAVLALLGLPETRGRELV